MEASLVATTTDSGPFIKITCKGELRPRLMPYIRILSPSSMHSTSLQRRLAPATGL